MRKWNLFKKNKLWLTGFGLATISSLILAACSTTDVTPPNNSNNNSEQPNSANTEGLNNNQTPETVTPIIPQATENQLAAAKLLLQSSQIKTVLANNKNTALTDIKAHLLTVNEVGRFSQDTVKDAKAALGGLTDVAITGIDQDKADAASVISLVNTLEAQLKVVENNPAIVPTNKKNQFSTAVNEVKVQATNLLAKLNALPAQISVDNNLLDQTKRTFEAALKTYVEANATTLNTAWTGLQKAHEDYQAKLNEITPKLIEAQKSGFDLDQATSELEKYINTDVATFLSDTTNGTNHSLVLNALVTKVRINVLGTAGYNLWAEGDAPKGIPTGTNKKPSTQLYAIVVGLANQTAAWNHLSEAIKTLTFNHNLILGTTSAVNVLALHLATPVPVDVARLNAYLIVADANVVKILTEGTDSIAKVLETIAKGISQYEVLLSEEGKDSLVQKLTVLENKVEDTQRKKKVTDLKTATQELVTKFATFKKEWNKLQPLLWTTSGTKITYPLLDNATNLNQLIGLANHYDDVLQVVGQAQSLKTLITQITTAVKPIPADTTNSIKEAPLIASLTGMVANINSLTQGFGKALNDFIAETAWTSENRTTVEALAKSTTTGKTTTKTGLIYTDLVEGVAAQTTGDIQTPTKLSLKHLKIELEKLQDTTGRKLHDLLGLLNKQLQPSGSSQTARLNNHLAAIFNNGNVLPESEVHN
ncbi:regulator of replication initiation timing [Mycoplasmoides fastidiosum]|uniref:Regulator of replication initiation timing n=1 Tax=Mycoplasmoides fastidiosum TaxID=92758 RepID=A0ABU0LZ74_9BACT|nr:hypothetical protein [Mycoplasmoides fastidiosum]MDQ0513974.1 regulator of replication initiation timing [Mycoplasmoides fastidiosum]UUD37612.1 hypothetical protein NPA10_03530 [Mycoplasmoides fastidiosum]